MAGGYIMISTDVKKYLALRRALGFKLSDLGRRLEAYAQFAEAHGDSFVVTTSAIRWAALAPSPHSRHIRLRDVIRLAFYLKAENDCHEIPPINVFPRSLPKRSPHIYTQEEVRKLMTATESLRPSYPMRRETYRTLIGLIASTGLRISEALNLRLVDVQELGILNIRDTKFRKSRTIPLHPTTIKALEAYILKRKNLPVLDSHLFLSASRRRISSSSMSYTFRRLLKLSGLLKDDGSGPRIHDLRHTFATQALERCEARGKGLSGHFVALSTYLGHTDIKGTYWYLEATPVLMSNMAKAAEKLRSGGGK